MVPVHAMLMVRDADVMDLIEKFGPDTGCEWYELDGAGRALEAVPRPAAAAAVQAVVRRVSPSTAAWKPFLAGLGVPIDLTPAPDGESALVVVRTEADPARTVIFCFGTASQSVPKDVIDGRFGLIVALNKHCGGAAIPAWRPQRERSRRRGTADSPVAVRQLQADVRGGHRHSLVAKSPSPSPVEGLGFDTVADLLRAIRVVTEDDMMPDLDGGRGLRFNTPLDGWSDLVDLAEHLVSLRARTDYRRGWNWVDHIVPVTPRPEVDRLLDVLFARIVDNEDAAVDLVLPDIDSDNADIGRLCFGIGREEPISAPVEWRLVRRHLLATRSRPSRPLHSRLRLRADGAPADTAQQFDLFDLLVAEFDDDTEHYVLSDGELLRVDAGFLKRLDARLRRLPWSRFPFATYSGGTERNYLEYAVTDSDGRLALLDQRNITLEGETAFEPCDLISDDGRLVFGKLKGRSSTFSHLCTQAEAAAALLLRHPAARDALLEKVAASGASAAVENAATDAMAALENRQPGRVTVTLLLLGSWRRRDLGSLPLLSRLRLQRAADAITDLGYILEIASPDVVLRRGRGVGRL
ncbi:DUF6119 family protein [Pseudonocardia sp.]|uniref:DUF6119 family protein n=1 Tax=Pseudonocardia sp. TaxID=60912 RepID=UPI003D1494FA